MLGDLTGKVAFITGGRQRHRQGDRRRSGPAARAAVADVDADGADRVAREIGGQGGEAIALQVDVASQEQIDAALEACCQSAREGQLWSREDLL